MEELPRRRGWEKDARRKDGRRSLAAAAEEEDGSCGSGCDGGWSWVPSRVVGRAMVEAMCGVEKLKAEPEEEEAEVEAVGGDLCMARTGKKERKEEKREEKLR